MGSPVSRFYVAVNVSMTAASCYVAFFHLFVETSSDLLIPVQLTCHLLQKADLKGQSPAWLSLNEV